MRSVLCSVVRSLSYIALVVNGASGQEPPDTLKQMAHVDADIVRAGQALQAVWPGFRFSEYGLAYVVPDRGKLVARWPSPLPDFHSLAEGLRHQWTDTLTLSWDPSLPVAALSVVSGGTRAGVAGLALHEAFHAYQRSRRHEGRRFGRGENSLLTVRYPLFDVQHEALFAVEAGLLERAVHAPDLAEAHRLARQFLAVRARRQRSIDSALVSYENLAELNEGLAQYVLVKGLEVLASHNADYRRGAVEEREIERRFLQNPLAFTDLSPRRRAYAAGSYLGLLLDRLAGDRWKQDVVRDDRYLGDLLHEIVGTDTVASSVAAEIARALITAGESVDRLAKTRAVQRDTILSGEIRIVLDPTLAERFSWCGFDPQNLLTTAQGEILHMRMLNLCHKGKRVAVLEQPAVEEPGSGRVLTSLRNGAFTLRVGGNAIDPLEEPGGYFSQRVQLYGEYIDVDIASADVLISGTAIVIMPR